MRRRTVANVDSMGEPRRHHRTHTRELVGGEYEFTHPSITLLRGCGAAGLRGCGAAGLRGCGTGAVHGAGPGELQIETYGFAQITGPPPGPAPPRGAHCS
ncbi:hypothetical protein GCM10010211_16250 [Streptomyces albospinus]|uniref:Uncharacterized protein n=1 Tax=Streptomyces albospinus TaxID=285515 RepID=A0ABQ2UT56_9ACTN|nr:hypothetical protein GCM10010211_16250 [Streptomyces albospinus]